MFRTILCVSLLSTQLFAGDGPSDPARLLPAKTIFYVGTPSLQAGAEAAKNSAMRKILDEPEVKAFLQKPVAQADKVLKRLVEASGLPAEATPKFTLSEMLSGTGTGMPMERFFVALTHVALPAAGSMVPDIGFVLGVEMKDAKDLGLCKALWSMIPVPEAPVTRGAHIFMVKQVPDGGPALVLAVVDRLAIFSTSQKSVEALLDNTTATGASLADTPEYKQIVGLAGGKLQADSSTWILRPDMVADIVRDALAMAQGAMAMSGADEEEQKQLASLAKVAEGIGLRSLRWVGGESHRDPQGRVIGATGVGLAESPSGLIGDMLASDGPVDLELIKTVPGKCLSMSMFSLDWVPHLYDFVVDSFRTFAPDEAAYVLGELQGFMGEASLRDDLLGNVHGVLLSYGLPGEGFPNRPTSLMRIPLRNPEGFVTALKSVVKGVSGAFPPMKALKFVESTHEGRPFYEIDMQGTPGAFVMMQPAMAIDNGALLLSLESATTVKTAINGLQGPSLAENKDFMAFVNGLSAKGKVTSLSYSDNARSFGAAYGQVAPMVSMMSGMVEGLPVDLSLMPTEQAITRHLGFSWNGSVEGADGVCVHREVSEFAVGDFMPLILTAAVIGADMAHGGGYEDEAAPPAPVAPEEQVQLDLQQISAAITIYKITQKDFPAALADLVKPLPDYPEGCLGKPELPMDPWGNAYLFRLNEKKRPVLWSAGPNGQDDGGTGDDIVKK